MADPVIQAFAIPTGGAIGLKLTTAVSGSVVLSRAVSGVSGLTAFTQLYSGSPYSETGETVFYLDIGDQTPGPLLNGTQYVYRLTDVNGTVDSPPVTSASSITLERQDYTQIIIALLRGSINAAGNLPDGVQKANVLNAMPLQGNPALPCIFVNPEILQQEELPIGVDDENAGDLRQPATENVWTQTEQDRHVFRLTVLSLNAVERNFYRDFIVAVLRMSLAYAFSQFGADTSRNFEATCYQSVDQTNLMIPGFYACDVLFEFVANSNIKVVTSYGIIEHIVGDITSIAVDLETAENLFEVPTL